MIAVILVILTNCSSVNQQEIRRTLAVNMTKEINVPPEVQLFRSVLSWVPLMGPPQGTLLSSDPGLDDAEASVSQE